MKSDSQKKYRSKAAVGPLEKTRGEPGEPEVFGRGPSAAAKNRHPDPEVVENPKRRRFSAKFKLRILNEADKASPGEVGELLRREGLYSSHLTKWRQLRKQGSLKALSERKRGPTPKEEKPVRSELDSLIRENESLKRRLERAEQIIDIQKKISQLLGASQRQEQESETRL